jgi:hypothetical protein
MSCWRKLSDIERMRVSSISNPCSDWPARSTDDHQIGTTAGSPLAQLDALIGQYGGGPQYEAGLDASGLEHHQVGIGPRHRGRGLGHRQTGHRLDHLLALSAVRAMSSTDDHQIGTTAGSPLAQLDALIGQYELSDIERMRVSSISNPCSDWPASPADHASY